MCSINSLLSQNQIDKIPQIQRDYTDINIKLIKKINILQYLRLFLLLEELKEYLQKSKIPI